MVLIFRVIFLLTKLIDQLVNFWIRKSLISVVFKPVVSLDDQLEELLGGFEQLKLAVVELFEVLLFQLIQTRLKYVLLA